MKTKITCPLGHSCEKIVDDHIERCAWYIQLAGSDPRDGKELNESRCAMAWQPILMVESTRANTQVAASVQSHRNETIKRQDIALGVLSNAKALTNK